jgi:DNA-binding response OmpR family regulator
MKILLVEDDARLAEVLVEALTDQRYIVDWVGDGETAWDQLRLQTYDLLLLDVGLPVLDGVQLCQRLRAQGFQIPVLMITARDASSDKVLGLDAGADDYMVKPLDLPELLARIRALSRRGQVATSLTLEWGSLILSPDTFEAYYQGQKLQLTPKEFALLELLIRSGRRVLSRRAILDHLWGVGEAPEEESIKAHIKTLRQKLKATGAALDPIETVHSVGYRLR